jgi:hypothetical protein
MHIRDRIKEFRRVKAGTLRPHPRNWRTHPPAQRDALRGVLAEVGYADALLVRQLPDGALQLIDGHLRAEITPDMEVPVLVLDLTEEEAVKLLALLDPLAGMAQPDREMLAELADEIETDNDAVRSLLDQLLHASEKLPEEAFDDTPSEVNVPESFQVVVECRDEAEQQTVYERLDREGFKCKLLTL